MDRRTMLGSFGAVLGAAIATQPAVAAEKQRAIGRPVQPTPEGWCWKICHERGEPLKFSAEQFLLDSFHDKANSARNFTLYQVLSECSSLSSLVVFASTRKSPLLKLHVEACAAACKATSEFIAKALGKESRQLVDQLGEISEACSNFAKTLKV